MKEEHQSLYAVEGIPLPETPEPDSSPAPWKKTRVVGKALPRVDGYERVSGTAIYPMDKVMPNMLYGAVLGSPHPHAKVKSVDAKEASKTPGAHAIISAFSGTPNPEWSYRGHGKTKIFDPHIRYEGDAVAAVAADTPYQAWDAIRKIKVSYETLPFVAEMEKALDKDAVKIHANGNRVTEPETYERGDVKKGFAQADVVIETEYSTECLLHTPMETHGSLAYWEGDRLILITSTQGVFGVQAEVAEALKLPLAKLRVIGHYMGGGFGSKLQANKSDVMAAILAKMTGRPVKLFLTREQSFLVAGNRPPNRMKLKAGVTKSGELTALEFTSLGTGGAYRADGVQLVDFLIRDNYLCPNVKCVNTDVYINAGPARPFRAPGYPQGSWALEQTLDQLARAIHMDPLDLRLKNIPDYCQALPGKMPYTSTGLKECLEEGAKAFGWRDIRKKAEEKSSGPIKRGYGMAGATWRVGGGWPPSTVVLKLFADGSANLNMGAADIGTGTNTVMVGIVSEELGLKRENIQLETADTGTTQFTPPSGGSKTIPSDGEATRFAAVNVKRQLLDMAAKDLGVDAKDLVLQGAEIVSKKDDAKRIKVTEVSEFKHRKVIIGSGYKRPNPADKVIMPFGAQFCEVEVNTGTGEIKVVRFVAAHESGRVMNSLTFDSQVYGGVSMGIGFGATEARVLDVTQTGKMCNANWHDYKVPTALDTPPDIESVRIDMPDAEANIIGAKGVGEPVTVPTAAAIANAVYDATGIRMTNTPITPPKLCRMLAEREEKE